MKCKNLAILDLLFLSLPTRERGLKCLCAGATIVPLEVAPYAGAWIEIHDGAAMIPHAVVAPYAGAWIEIAFDYAGLFMQRVAPYAGAWIEIHVCTQYVYRPSVAPYAGAWIEIRRSRRRGFRRWSPLCGNMD